MAAFLFAIADRVLVDIAVLRALLLAALGEVPRLFDRALLAFADAVEL